MPESFGARLRRKREEQQIALASIAADTKIKLTLLEALERDDLSGWPSGIFRRGYVRAYARAIGLPPDEIVNEFVALYPEPDESALPLSAAFPKSAEPESWRERIWQFGRRTVQAEAPLSSASPPAISKAQVVTAAPAPPLESPDFEVAVSEFSDSVAPPEAAPLAAANETAPPSTSDPSAPTLDNPQTPASFVRETPAAPVFEPDLAATAKLCTVLGQVEDGSHLTEVLEQAAAVLNAAGLIVWLWDRPENTLVPAFTHGYPSRFLTYLGPLATDSDNATAAAFRAAELRIVKGTSHGHGALVAPLMRASGCIGVLAIEVPDGVEQVAAAGHLVQIVAAQLATMFELSVATAADPPADDRDTRTA